MKTSADDLRERITTLEQEKADHGKEIGVRQTRVSEIDKTLYELKVRELHVQEIYRLAKIHLPRLQKHEDGELTDADIRELEKWIGRAKTEEGLINIRNALAEMVKYYSKEVRKNVYALIQKIIIEGPHGK